MAVSKEWDFLKSFLHKTYNHEVNKFFNDIPDEVLEEIDEPRKAAKRACLILPKETMIRALHKRMNFYYICQRVQDRPDYVGGKPKQEMDDSYPYAPHVYLFFKQDKDASPEGFEPLEIECSFVLTDETSETITEANLKTLANKIKAEFATNDGYLWKKGSYLYTYKDLKKGLNLQIYSISEAEAKEVIHKLCSIVGATYDDEKLTEHNPKKSTVNNPPTRHILGESRKGRRYRPTGNCRFRNAKISINGIPRLMTLVDLSGRKNSLV
ncbi:hypothetical protein [Gloeothece verrucosa]|uniref:Uncharacterized protein n=1 Tax=Gloeothece verrucosa (strain PCC 7822) TaxID=497965 RepID=E0U7U4_GLOV7|nr:hypothetical protein [Gloeothece verrucosa]ADN14578.1 conserved hypothetical protein [Gloeothece verrucosa PCC 7822]ADN14906.1 conserved hypothetical protein [Gloeothece verrucosa PCC 7822]ADN15221.1 conserved hypothetical protein [Gloeothece verrucosa PCC 7822]ADN16430.1 conserved hypothetical protein [Gloeothece verrucosa PCC 7822]